jgi:hypothetical protein
MTKQEEYPELSLLQHEIRIRVMMQDIIRRTVGSENAQPDEEAVVLTGQYFHHMGWTDREYFKRVDGSPEGLKWYNVPRNEAKVAIQNVYDIYKVMIDLRPRCPHVAPAPDRSRPYTFGDGYCGEMSCHNYYGKVMPDEPRPGLIKDLNEASKQEGGEWLR